MTRHDTTRHDTTRHDSLTRLTIRQDEPGRQDDRTGQDRTFFIIDVDMTVGPREAGGRRGGGGCQMAPLHLAMIRALWICRRHLVTKRFSLAGPLRQFWRGKLSMTHPFVRVFRRWLGLTFAGLYLVRFLLMALACALPTFPAAPMQKGEGDLHIDELIRASSTLFGEMDAQPPPFSGSMAGWSTRTSMSAQRPVRRAVLKACPHVHEVACLPSL